MTEREVPGGLDERLGAFSADSGAPGHDNLYDEDVSAEISTEISDLEFSSNVPRRVIRAKPEGPDDGAEDGRGSNERGAEAKRSVTVAPGNKAGMWLGSLGIGCALASWLAWPALFGLLATILGAGAFALGRKSLGGWAAVLGLVSAVLAYRMAK